MQKNNSNLSIVFLTGGILLGFLRLVHIKKYIEESGLAAKGLPTTVINLLPAVSLILCFIIAYSIAKNKMINQETPLYHHMRSDIFFLVLQIAAAILIAVHGVISYPTAVEIFRNHNQIGLPLAIVCAVSVLVNAILIYTDKQKAAAGYLTILIPLYFCLQLGEIFMANLANPTISAYSFECISLGAAALFLVAQAGCIMKRDQVTTSVFTALMALLFTPGAVAKAYLYGRSLLLYIAIILIILPEFMVILGSLVPRPKKKKRNQAE